jgi:hypothetical protein
MPAKAGTSKVIRVSSDVADRLAKHKGSDESWDTYLRRHLGMSSKDGTPQALRTYYVVPGEKPLISLYKSEAKGIKVIEEVKQGKKLPAVIEVRELV